ncbi:MAG: NADH-dependent [FeFe] hydrogenase, group A6 [Armatimonadota bacterium]
MATITLTINGREVTAPAGSTVLEAAEQAGIYIPTLCHHPDLKPAGVCRVCLVEVKGQPVLQPACVFPASNGLVVDTDSHAVREARRTTVQLLLSNHPDDCLACVRNRSCELQELAERMGITDRRYAGARNEFTADDSSSVLVRDPEKCILCRRCLGVCQEIQGVGAINVLERGWKSKIGPAFGMDLADAVCVYCGQCIDRCPTGALTEHDATEEVWKALRDPNKFVVVQTAPAVRAAIGEEFGMPAGSLVTEEMVSGLRRLGFDRVFDTDFTADLTIMEEGHELIQRLNEGGALPLITSCSPGWIRFMEFFYPEMMPNVSTCKSPQQMFGAVAKTYYAEKAGVDPANMVVVSVMPCTAKKFEASRPEMRSSGYQDVDYVLTTRELGKMMRQAGIDLPNLPKSDYDDPLGASTGAAVIFGATGGVMEAALRTAYEVVTGKTLDRVDFMDVRGMEGIKGATIPLDGISLNVAVAHGLANARKLLDQVRSGEANYHFIEIMCCPGGCLGGGGQPVPTNPEVRKKRAEAIYRADRELPIRKSHENPSVQQLYAEFLGKPLGHKSHELLHTHYTARERWRA